MNPRRNTMIERSGFVAVAGRPNVGKSTLLNGLVAGKVSIVSPRKQTTRSVIRAISEVDGAQIAWLDTPGWQMRHGGTLNRSLNGAAEWALAAADCVVFVVDATAHPAADNAMLEKLPADRPLICAVNKIDLLANKNAILPIIEAAAARRDFVAILPLSALGGDGVEELKKETGARLPLRAALFPDGDAENASGEGREFLFAELLREKLFRYLDEELPYKAAVVTDSIRVDKKLLRVDASIFVEKESQKRIVIGRGGGALKEIATAARLDMEQCCRAKVFLTVRVRVADWMRDDALLRRMRVGRGGVRV